MFLTLSLRRAHLWTPRSAQLLPVHLTPAPCLTLAFCLPFGPSRPHAPAAQKPREFESFARVGTGMSVEEKEHIREQLKDCLVRADASDKQRYGAPRMYRVTGSQVRYGVMWADVRGGVWHGWVLAARVWCFLWQPLCS